MNKNIGINRKIQQLQTTNSLFKLFYEEEAQFDSVNLSTLLNKLSKIIFWKCFSPCEKKVLKIVSLIPLYDFDPRGIANILNAFSKWPISIQRLSI